MTLYVPPLSLCGDNAAMIGCQGYYEFLAGNIANESLNAVATMSLDKVTRKAEVVRILSFRFRQTIGVLLAKTLGFSFIDAF